MKKEILRINDLNMEYNIAEKVANISVCLLGGECVGFLGLENSGKNLLVDFICGKYELDLVRFYVNGRRHISANDLQKYIYKITASNYLIDDWTVAEYIFLVDDRSFFNIMNRKRLINQAESLFKKFHLTINPEKKLKQLSELEKRMVDLCKAYSREARIIVIEDEFDGCATEDIIQFKQLLDNLIRNDIASVINSHSDMVSYILSDKYFIFKKGRIVKKCNKRYVGNNSNLESLLLGISAAEKTTDSKHEKKEQSTAKKIVFSISHMVLKKKIISQLDFYEREVVTILVLDVKEKKHIFELLSGRYIDKSMCIVLDDKVCNSNGLVDFVQSRIVSISDMGGGSELLLSMSVGDNLLMPSLKKISSWQHVLREHRVTKMLENQVNENIMQNSENVKNMSVNDFILLLMERWYIYKPRVLVLFEPFAHCDIYGISMVKSYIKKFTEIGTTVIIIKSREEYVQDISDRIIPILS